MVNGKLPKTAFTDFGKFNAMFSLLLLRKQARRTIHGSDPRPYLHTEKWGLANQPIGNCNKVGNFLALSICRAAMQCVWPRRRDLRRQAWLQSGCNAVTV